MPAVIHGHKHVTNGLVKEAVFQLFENAFPAGQLSAVTFADLCSGSGQMGLEAVSRGYKASHLVESDQLRFSDLKKLMKRDEFRNLPVTLHRKDFKRTAPLILENAPAAVFIDPPYSFWKNGRCESVEKLILSLYEENNQSVVTILQGPQVLETDRIFHGSVDAESRDYRGQKLTVIRPG